MAQATSDIVEKLVTSVDCKQGAVRAVRYNTDGNYCLSCGSDKSLKLWNPLKGTLLKTYSGHGYEVLDACGSCDNSLLCSGGMDKTLIIFDVATGNVMRKYRGHAGTVNCVGFNDEGTVALSGSLDCTVKAWDCRSKRNDPIQTLDDASDSVTSLALTAHELVTGSADGKTRRYDLRMGKLFADYVGRSVTSVCFSRDEQCLLVGSQDNTLRLMDKDTGELLNEYEGHRNESYKIDSVISSSDKHILSGSEDGKVYVWDLVEAKVVGTLPHRGASVVHSLAYHPTEVKMLSAARGTMYVWTDKYGQSLDT